MILSSFCVLFHLSHTIDSYDAETNLWFHVTGFKGPDFPSVYSLPSDDVPLLRLHRPPGDQSQAFLQRSWASSVEIGFSREDGEAVRFNQDLRSKFGSSAGGELCLGTGVGGRLFVFIVSDYALNFMFRWYWCHCIGDNCRVSRFEIRHLGRALFQSGSVARIVDQCVVE